MNGKKNKSTVRLEYSTNTCNYSTYKKYSSSRSMYFCLFALQYILEHYWQWVLLEIATVLHWQSKRNALFQPQRRPFELLLPSNLEGISGRFWLILVYCQLPFTANSLTKVCFALRLISLKWWRHDGDSRYWLIDRASLVGATWPPLVGSHGNQLFRVRTENAKSRPLIRPIPQWKNFYLNTTR
jgi:hypothetical protein